MKVNIILASAPNCVIGNLNHIPWRVAEDFKHFKKTTLGTTIVMGSLTWKGFRGKPLPERFNIVVTRHPEKIEGCPDLIISCLTDILTICKDKEVWIIGGAQIYNQVLANPVFQIGQLLISRIGKVYEGDTLFHNVFDYRIASTEQRSGFQLLSYEKCPPKTNEAKYLALLRRVLETGVNQDDRTGVGTLALFGEQLKFDLKEGFPLLTTKKMAWKAIQEELFLFVSGKTDTKALEAKGVNIWSAHTSAEFIALRGLEYKEGNLGKMYGYQWRHYNGGYDGYDDEEGIDQLLETTQKLQKDPYSRRNIMTTWNPEQLDEGVLEPCHGLVLQWFCRLDDDGKFWLSAHMYQRSADIILGLSWNIASYAALVHLMARAVDMIPDTLTISLGNVHLYKNHLEQAREQLVRAPLAAPRLEVVRDVDVADWDKLDTSWLKLWGYFYHPKIPAPLAV